MTTEGNEVIFRDKLTRSKKAEAYVKKLEEMYEDIVNTPHFIDEEVFLEQWSLEWFHKETKDEIEWTIVVAMNMFINATGYEVSYCLKNESLKKFATAWEQYILGNGVLVVNDLNSLEGFTVSTSKVVDQEDWLN